MTKPFWWKDCIPTRTAPEPLPQNEDLYILPIKNKFQCLLKKKEEITELTINQKVAESLIRRHKKGIDIWADHHALTL